MEKNKLVHGGDIYSYENIIDFSANINPLGIPEGVKKAICENIESYKYYPDPLSRELKNALSEYYSVPTQFIVCGNGAADIIYKLILNLKPKKAGLIAPTFSEYEKALELINSEVTHFLLKEENEFYLTPDFLDFLKADLNIVFLCNPNNPTGIPVSKNEIKKIAEITLKNNTTLVLDECFTDFLENESEISFVEYLERFPNVIILKAFTKMYAMAGIRLGYSLSANISLNEKINNTLQPWSVSVVATKAGIAALKEKEYVENTKKYIGTNRDYLIVELKKLGIKVYDSKANYIFFKSDYKDLFNQILKYNILIRSCGNYMGLNSFFYRIAVKNYDENKYFIDSLKKVLENSDERNINNN